MDDLISRNAAIDRIEEHIRIGDELYRLTETDIILNHAFEIAASCVYNLPSAQERKKRWIPCSERLPEDLEEVNVTWVNHIPEPYYDFLKDNPFTGSAVYYKGEWFWYSNRCVDILAEYGTNDVDKVDDGIEITAWMPLPEPYKGEEK